MRCYSYYAPRSNRAVLRCWRNAGNVVSLECHSTVRGQPQKTFYYVLAVLLAQSALASSSPFPTLIPPRFLHPIFCTVNHPRGVLELPWKFGDNRPTRPRVMNKETDTDTQTHKAPYVTLVYYIQSAALKTIPWKIKLQDIFAVF